MNPRIQFDTINNIKRLHRGYWFTPDAMRFFKSKVYDTVILFDEKYWFISSEKGPSDERRYSIRTMKLDGTIDTHGEFQQFKTKKQAERELAKITGLSSFFA